MPIFCFKSVKIYTGQKNLHWRRQWRQWQLWGMKYTTTRADLYMSYGSILIFNTSFLASLSPLLSLSLLPPSLSSRSGHNVASRSDWSDCRITVVHKKAIFAANLASGCKTGQSAGICNKKNISRIICWQAEGRFWEHSLLKKKQYLEWYMRASHGRLWEWS